MNTKLTKWAFIINLFLLVAGLGSCTASLLKSTIKEDGKQIPSNFGKLKTTILVVQHGVKRDDKNLEENWNKYYKGDFILVTEKEVKEPKYNDLTKFQYIFDDVERSFTTTENKHLGAVSFYLYDRKDGQNYSLNAESGLYSSLLKAYVVKLEEVRAKNSKN
jgi:hypothetical protein